MRASRFAKLRKLSLSFIAVAGSCSVLGCVSKEQVTTYEVTKSGKNAVERESVIKKQSGPNRKCRIEKEYFREQIKCINKKGKTVDVSTPEECFELGGKIIDKTVD